MGQTYMLYTGHRMTWENVANIYSELIDLKVEWVPVGEYTAKRKKGGDSIMYDRNYDRDVDNTKILNATGLKPEDFTSFKEGIRQGLEKVGAI